MKNDRVIHEFLHTRPHNRRLGLGGAVPTVRATLTSSNIFGCDSTGSAAFRFIPAAAYPDKFSFATTFNGSGLPTGWTTIGLDGENTYGPASSGFRVLSAVISVEPTLAFNANSGTCTAIPYIALDANAQRNDPDNNIAANQRKLLPACKPVTWCSVPTDDNWHNFYTGYQVTSGASVQNQSVRTWQSLELIYRGLNNGAASNSALLVTVAIHCEYLPMTTNATSFMSQIAGHNPPHNQAQLTKHENVLRAANAEGPLPLAVDDFMESAVGKGVEKVGGYLLDKLKGAAGYVGGDAMASTALTNTSVSLRTKSQKASQARARRVQAKRAKRTVVSTGRRKGRKNKG